MNQDLENMYQYFMHIKNDPQILKDKIVFFVKKKDSDELGNLNNIINKFYEFMVDYHDYNKLPKVMSDEKYNEFDSPEMYHGFTNFAHPATLLTHWNYHYGQGITPGFYATNIFDHAKQYTVKEEYFGFLNKNKVMKLKFNTDKNISLGELEIMSKYIFNPEMINMVDYPEEKKKIDELRNFAVRRDPENAHDFLSLFLTASILGVYLGYDGIVYRNDNNLIYFIGLDRSRLILSNSEAERFLKLGKSFKNGTLNKISDEEADQIIYESDSEVQKF